jgi:hypothetical protein
MLPASPAQGFHLALLARHGGGCNGIAGRMPHAQNPHMVLVVADMKDDSVNTFSFAVNKCRAG